MRIGHALLTLAAGCGRVDFDPRRDAGLDAQLGLDGNPACVDDGVCTYGCADEDPDCATTCGDGVCMGNGGELCVNCAADCMTTTAVCGNGACDPGESPLCIADCGPSPWPWASEEAALLAKVNAVRATGYNCPNGARAARPAYTDAGATTAAREWTWELAHQKFFMMGGTVCNGRTFAQRSQNFALYMNAALVTGPSYPDVDAALAKWLSNANECDGVMATYTQASIGVAHDSTNAYVMILK